MYVYKNGKIKLKYSCNSEFHAKANHQAYNIFFILS